MAFYVQMMRVSTIRLAQKQCVPLSDSRGNKYTTHIHTVPSHKCTAPTPPKCPVKGKCVCVCVLACCVSPKRTIWHRGRGGLGGKGARIFLFVPWPDGAAVMGSADGPSTRGSAPPAPAGLSLT